MHLACIWLAIATEAAFRPFDYIKISLKLIESFQIIFLADYFASPKLFSDACLNTLQHDIYFKLEKDCERCGLPMSQKFESAIRIFTYQKDPDPAD